MSDLNDHRKLIPGEPIRSGTFLDCAYCGKLILPSKEHLATDNVYFSFCNKEHLKLFKEADAVRIKKAEDLKKYEEIKRMAWEFCNTNYENIKQMYADNKRTCSPTNYCAEISWQMAEKFYEHAKAKQEEADVK